MRFAWVLPTVAALLAAGMVPVLADTVTVTIDKLAFSPKEVSVKAGDSVKLHQPMVELE